MTKTILYAIVIIVTLLLIYLGCHSYSRFDTNENNQMISIQRKGTIVDSTMTSIFHPDEININMIFKKSLSNRSEGEDFNMYRKQFDFRNKYYNAYQKDISTINLLAEANDTIIFLEKIDSFLRKWRNKKETTFYNESVFYCWSKVSDHSFLSEDRKMKRNHDYLNLLNKNIDVIHPEYYRYFMLYGKYEINYLQQLNHKTRIEKRKELLIKWMYMGMMLQASIDTNYNFKQQLWANVGIPLGFEGSDEYVAGINPTAIKEPALRKAYHDSILINGWRITKDTRQTTLRKGYKEWITYLQTNIMNLYALPPTNNNELDSILNEYIIDEEYKQSIIDLVEKNKQNKT
jgi:hypothetical protein